MVHQIENPYITEEFPFPRTSYYEQTNQKIERSDILKNEEVAFFKDLYNLHTNTSKQNTVISQAPSKRRFKSRKRQLLLKSQRFSNQTRIKLGHGNLLNKTVNVSHFHFQRRLSNGTRSSRDDSRRISDSESDFQRRSEMVQTSKSYIEEAETIKQHLSDSETNIKRKREADLRKDAETTKVGFDYVKSAESNSETRRRNNKGKNSWRPLAKVFENSTTHNTVAGNVSQFRDRAMTAKQNSRSAIDVSRSGANTAKPTAKIIRSETLDSILNRIYKAIYDRLSRQVVSQYQLKQETTNDLQDFDDLQNSTFEQILSKVFSIYEDFNQRPKESPEMVNNNRGKQSSEVVSNYEANLAPKILRDSDQPPKKKRRSLLIFGDDRSGTTFVTKMFAADPQMFAVYEPLWVTEQWFKQFGIVDPENKGTVVKDVVNGLLSCQFTHSEVARSFLAYTDPSWVSKGVFEKNVFKTSAFVARTKSGKIFWPDLYKYPKFAEDVCLKKFNHSVVKVGQVRSPRESISTFIPSIFHENADTDVRIIQIVRDPRGSINSRIKSGWISDFTYMGFPRTVYSLCSNIAANIKVGRKLSSLESVRNRYMEIKYREIATMPVTTAKKIYKFAGFEMPDSLIDWIVRSTNPDEEELAAALENPFSHIRDSSTNHMKWRKESPIKRVRIIEQQCKKLLDLLGLDPVADEMETLCS